MATKVKKKILKVKYDTAKMDDANRAMCYALRHPPGRGAKPMKYCDIQKMVRKTNGRLPKIQAIAVAANTYKDAKGQRGRPKGSCKTSKAEDKKILKTFHKLRPPGCGIDSHEMEIGLPKKIILFRKIMWTRIGSSKKCFTNWSLK